MPGAPQSGWLAGSGWVAEVVGGGATVGMGAGWRLLRDWGLVMAQRGPQAAREEGSGILLAGQRGSISGAPHQLTAGVEAVLVVFEGLPVGQGEGEDEVVVLALGAVAAEVDQLVLQFRDAGRCRRQAELLAA